MVSLLISAEALAHLGDPTNRSDRLRIVDCRWYLGEPARGRQAFEAGHLPGAVYASLDDDLSVPEGPGRHPLPTPKQFAATMSRLGIDRTTKVVAYDDRGGAVAARLWWMLTAVGHRDVVVLDGGIQAWTAQGGSLTTVTEVPEPKTFEPAPWTGVATIDDVVTRPERHLLIDARGRERYEGRTEPVDPKAGHIPGAISMPLTEQLDRSLRFLPPPRLRDRFVEAGLDEADRVISHCGSGVTACHTVLAMELAGLPRPLLFVGSWSEWSGTDLPIATGSEP